ncbi:M28 family metallopeptidase (plasmid) [Rhizobium sullae]|uniref:Aminopeptidase n=1 Tax=Rhizobium sullae TaxID=50338 RepID=A0A2N0D9A4_RHISU|nr:M28 family peptidase [Rhizobium sullae]PKA42691.1 aminopeptidase [Rhizobium sullae]UWU18078.1 M28 family metallopeptidase [Rhizobium sullae]
MPSTAPLPDRAHLVSHIREFSRRVKLSGTPEELESFAYLQAEMNAAGYQTRLIAHDAFISLPGRAKIEIDGMALPCITHSMSVSSAGITAELVYVGEGSEAHFADRDVTGRIVLADGIATEEVAALASAAGAIGQIHVSPNEHLYEMCVSPVWGSPSQHTRAKLPSTVICSIRQEDGERLRRRLAGGERVHARLEAEVDAGWRKTPLLVAELSAENGPDDAPFVLFSGHHDTWHFGVMDNGGANATMLEAAHVLAETRSEWRRGLRLCFWSGHSHGRYSGSAWYADEYFDELERRCVAHVNVDSTGGEGATVLTNSAVIDELKAVAADAVAAISGQKHAGRRHGRAADQSFWGVGIPSMFGSLSHQPPGPVKMLTALGWWWHTPHDTMDHIDPENLERDTRIVLEVLWRLLTSPVLPYDYAAYATSLQAELDHLERALDGRLDISALKDGASELERQAIALARLSDGAAGETADRINASLLRASRQLVPLNYTSGERFHHDPALPHRPWASLEGIDELARLPAGSPDTAFYAVHARQTRNRIASALRQANEALREALQP